MIELDTIYVVFDDIGGMNLAFHTKDEAVDHALGMDSYSITGTFTVSPVDLVRKEDNDK